MEQQHIEKESHTANKRLAQWLVKWLIEHSASHQILWFIDRIPLRIKYQRS